METKLVAHFEKAEGTACFAPYVDVTISALTGRKVEEQAFKYRIDTGADITCVPSEQVKHLMPLLLGRPVLIRGHDGKVKKMRTHLMIVTLGIGDDNYESFRPERGVMLTDSDIGLIGMDILPAFEVHLTNETLTLTLAK